MTEKKENKEMEIHMPPEKIIIDMRDNHVHGRLISLRMFKEPERGKEISEVITGFITQKASQEDLYSHNVPVSAYLSLEETQILIDRLWSIGARPSGMRHRDEAVSAMNKHLEDMRQIAFTGLGYEKPKE